MRKLECQSNKRKMHELMNKKRELCHEIEMIRETENKGMYFPF